MQSAAPQDKHRSERPQLHDDNTTPTSTSPVTDVRDDVKSPPKPPWRALFFFTTRSHIPLLASGLLASVAAGAANPARSFLLGKLYQEFTAYSTDSANDSEFLRNETKWVIYLVGLAGTNWIFHSLEFAIWLAFGELQAKSARDRLFYGLLEKDVEWYDMRKRGIGALLPRMQAQIRELQLAAAQPLGSVCSLAATAVLSLVQAFLYSWDLTLVTLASAPLIMAALIWVGNGMQKQIEKQEENLTEAQKCSTNALCAIETVKCFNGQEYEAENYRKAISHAASCYARVANSSALQMALVVMLSVSMIVQGFYYGGVLISKGRLNSGKVVTTFFSAVGAFQALQEILPQMIVLEKGRAAGASLRAAMAQVRSGPAVQKAKGLTPASCHGDIDVRDLSFAYPTRPTQLVLENVNLYIPGGETTFLIGKSGSGKSTIGQLLLRFYQAQQGIMTIDDVALDSLNVNWLRSNITLVEQQSLLFNDTVFKNIAFGRKDYEYVTKAEVTAAAEFALLQQMITDLPKDLNTVVGNKGSSMSGGQRQRMALARARLRDTPILILDECTSALDHISRTLIMEAIRRWRQGKTTIVITHDISQIFPDDYIFILERGKLVQEGYRKHMERLKDTPFQSFLKVEQQSVMPILDIRENPDLTNPFEIPGPDALEDKSEVWESGTNKVSLQWFGGDSRRPPSQFASSWMQKAVSPRAEQLSPSPRPSSYTTKARKNFMSSLSDSKEAYYRQSQTFPNLVHRAGEYAAESRLHTSPVVRRNLNSEKFETAPLHGTSQNHVDSERGDWIEHEVLPLSLIFRTLWPSLPGSVKILLAIGFWGATIHAVASPLFAFALSKLLDTYAIPGGDRPKALLYASIILCISITDALHTYLYRFFLEYSGQRWVDYLRSKAFKRILYQPRSFFEAEENNVSHIASCLDQNAEEMRNLLGRFAALLYIATLLCIVTIGWALIVQWKLTLVALAAAPYIYGVTKMFSAVSEKWESASNEAAEAASAVFTETFTNIKTVRALTLESHFKEKYIKATNTILKIGFLRSLYAGFFYGLSDSAGNFSTSLIFYMGARMVVSGTPVSDVIQVFTMLMFAIANVSAILSFIPQIESSKDTASRLLRLARLADDSHEHHGDTRIVRAGDIVFDRVSFAYPSQPSQPVLRGLSLRIRSGTCVSIVGSSGCGKSTLANLLLNLYSTGTNIRACTGRLTFSGRDINRIHTPTLRTLVVPVSQTPTVFAASITDNIAYGLRPDSPYRTPASIKTAVQQAGIHDFIISLPQGYDTLVGEGGMGLSGGQAQRLALARALVRQPAVLILDEATSALDVETALLVRQTLRTLIHRRAGAMTVLIITHDREMMEMADRVVVLDQGTVAEEGTFRELMARNGALVNLLSGGEWNG